MLIKSYKIQRRIERRELNKLVLRNSAISPLGGLRLAGVLKSSIGVTEQSRILSRYSIAYIISGKGKFRGKTVGEVDVSDGDAILVRPGELHWYGPDVGTTWSEVFFEFEGPVFDLWFEKGNFDWGAPVRNLKPIEYWKERILTTIGEGNNGNPAKMVAEVVRVQAFLADILDHSRVNFFERIAWLEDAKIALIEQPNGRSAALSLGLSYESFRKRFKSLVGLSPGKYRTSLIMDKACKIMDDETRTIRSIAEELGFCDEFHFSKQFKRTIGWTPSDYRTRFSRQYEAEEKNTK